MDKDKITFWVEYRFINVRSLDEEWKDKIYPIAFIEAVVHASEPRKPTSMLRAIEKSKKVNLSYGSFMAYMEELTRDMENMQSKFQIHLPVDLKKKAKKENKKIVLTQPPNYQAPLLLGADAQEVLESKGIDWKNV
jgi:hypothetical protein